MDFSPTIQFWIKIIVVTVFVSIPIILTIAHPLSIQFVWENNRAIFLAFLFPGFFVVIRQILKRTK